MKQKIKSFLATYWILMLMVAIKFALQYLLVNPAYELHRDEFLHLDQANHLSAGYISVPPFTAFLSKIIYWLGGGLFWIRFFPALFGAATIVFAWLIVEAMDGKLPAKILTSIFLLFSILLRINVLYQPNALDVLVWTIIFYLLIRYIRKQENMLLLAFGCGGGPGVLQQV
ncbi:MAG: glycosyltransferase family 39 protein [Cyclobacteriaceae bacterium]|nr:glycosyltransferase family 39 protein [Cyclobacteriaceae bacterium]